MRKRLAQLANGLIALVIVSLIYVVGAVCLLLMALAKLITGEHPLSGLTSEYPRRKDVKPYPPEDRR